MPLSEAAEGLLRAALAERDALIDRATDIVFHASPDLAGQRPRIVTRMLIERVFACSEAALFQDDRAPFDLFIDHVTGLRAETGFHVSTLLLGFRTFRSAIEEPLRRLAADPWVAWEVLVAADDLYTRTGPRAADLLVERQEAALRERKAKLERQNARISAELRQSEDTASALRAELEACTVTLVHLEQDLKQKNATIAALTGLSRSNPKLMEQAALLREELKKTES